MYSVWMAVLALMWLASAPTASADSVTDAANTVWGGGMTYVPPADLTGWFFDSNGPPALPESDPSQIWTSPENIATLNEWLALVTDLGDDPALLQEMYGLGMIAAPNAAAVAASEALVNQLLGEQDQGTGGVPEPLSLGLLTGGLAMACVYAAIRARRIRYGRTKGVG